MSEERRRAFSWPVAFTVVAIVMVVAASTVAIYVVRATREIPGRVLDGGREVLKDLGRIAQAFQTGTVTTSFISYATEARGSNYFQFTTLKEVEVFERKHSAAAFWGQLQLPDVVVRASAPVEYTYYLDFDKKWEFHLEEKTIRVIAPPIEFNTPAIDASAIRFEVVEGSVLRDEDTALDALRRGLTEASKTRARDNIPLVREMGRRRTAEFVDKWLAHSFTDGESYRVDVIFRDELPARKPEAPR